MDFLPQDCMDIVVEKRISDMENEVLNLKNIVIKKLEDKYEKEKNKKPGKFNFEAFRIAIDIKVFINQYEKSIYKEDDEDDDEDEDDDDDDEEEERVDDDEEEEREEEDEEEK